MATSASTVSDLPLLRELALQQGPKKGDTRMITGSEVIHPKSSECGQDRSGFDFIALQGADDSLPGRHSDRLEYIGSATSHFQAEPLLYDEDGRSRAFSDWELELTRRIQGQRSGIPNADTSALPRFLARKEKYIRRSTELSENMFRFSLEFGRLCPEAGQFNEQLMTEYVKALALIKQRGQEPFITLHHFTMPRYLIEIDREEGIRAGGWEHRDALQHFRFYTENVIRFLADESRIRDILAELNLSLEAQKKILSDGLARYFMTLNEPTVLLFSGYVVGLFPPYKRGNLLAVRRLLKRLVEAHDIALDQIKQGLKTQKYEPQVGVGHNWQHFEGLLGEIGKRFQEHFLSGFEREGRHSDFLGIHYYFRWRGLLSRGERKRREYGDLPIFGDVYTPGILDVIRRVNSLYAQKPIFISEFGFSDSSDLRRPYWILETVRYILEAKRTGAPVRGVLLWTLVDNFEWQFGMSQKFGLFSEAELDEPPIPSTRGIKSWEVWRATTKAMTSPTMDNLQELQRCHQAAYVQYKEAGGRY